ncbi:MAG: Hsp70 family protein [Myxococcales bacterium]|nr:Hsp70 family protein [Myxococcales bacterium]
MKAPVIGIDLGTSNSVVSVVIDGEPVVIPDETNRTIQPSAVSFLANGKIIVGYKAKERLLIDPLHTISYVKRLIGRRFDDPDIQKAIRLSPYPIVRGEDDFPRIICYDIDYTVPEISAMIVRRMKQIAEKFLGVPVEQAVITVPANFNDFQRNETKLAGELAGLEVLRIINEPTAAALAYGYKRGEKMTIAIYDFGGGTFDITILRLNNTLFEVLSTAGDTFLGGEDFDRRLLEYMMVAFKHQSGVDLSNDKMAIQRMKALGEKVKIELSDRKRVKAQVKELTTGADGPMDFNFSITQEGFRERCSDIVERTFEVCDEALGLAGIRKREIDCVILVGGTTRIPFVREMVELHFGNSAFREINPDEVVAIGAGIQASILGRDFDEESSEQLMQAPLLLDVTPQSLGILTVGGMMDVVITRNSVIPTEQTRYFTTAYASQDRALIEVFQGESRNARENLKLGEFELNGLSVDERAKIGITFEIDTNGIVKVRAKDDVTGAEQQVQIRLNTSDGRTIENPWM